METQTLMQNLKRPYPVFENRSRVVDWSRWPCWSSQGSPFKAAGLTATCLYMDIQKLKLNLSLISARPIAEHKTQSYAVVLRVKMLIKGKKGHKQVNTFSGSAYE